MVSVAQKRAAAKYAREKTKTITLRLYPTDTDILEHLGRQENKQGYLKKLIRADMERGE